MLAVSRTLRDGLMSAFEFLCIVERDGGLVYTAMPNGRTPATDFTLTKIDDDERDVREPGARLSEDDSLHEARRTGRSRRSSAAEGGQKARTYVFTQTALTTRPAGMPSCAALVRSDAFPLKRSLRIAEA